MRIAVNTRHLFNEAQQHVNQYMKELLERLIIKYPEHDFLFLFDRKFNDEFITADNLTMKVVGPSIKNAINYRWWYDIKLPSALKKWKAEILLSFDGACSLNTKVPQVIVLDELSLTKRKLFLPKYFKTAVAVVTISEYCKQVLRKKFKVFGSKLSVVPKAANKRFVPIGWEEKEDVKAGYADGREYFLFIGNASCSQNAINVLKAFSEFKRWQQSNWKLIITENTPKKNLELADKLNTYKFRDDVIVISDVKDENFPKLLAGAYATLYPGTVDEFALPVLEAMQSGVAVITIANTSIPEIAEEAVLYAEAGDPHSLAVQMIELYKDENLRDQLISEGIEQAKKFSWDDSAEKLWKVISNVTAANKDAA